MVRNKKSRILGEGRDESVKMSGSIRFDTVERQKLLDINEKLAKQLERNMETFSELNKKIMKKD